MVVASPAKMQAATALAEVANGIESAAGVGLLVVLDLNHYTNVNLRHVVQPSVIIIEARSSSSCCEAPSEERESVVWRWNR